ncbi:MAG: hypothetical protein ACI3XR_08910 [Eubacteriales bacterium]
MSATKEVGVRASEKSNPFRRKTSAFEMVQRKGVALAVALAIFAISQSHDSFHSL